jgi:hypothetical protein
MRNIGLLFVAAIVIALAASSSANARTGPGELVTPDHRFDGWTGGQAMGEGWARALSLPVDENPALSGEHCVRLGAHEKVLLVLGFDAATCSVPHGTVVGIIGITTFCDDVEIGTPFFADGETVQRECAVSVLAPLVVSIQLTVNDGKPIDLHQPIYEAFSPQRSVQLLDDNILFVEPGPATLTAFGWVAWLADLPVGRYVLRSEADFTHGDPHVWAPVINVMPAS